ncbi:MAG: GxxExxY protein [Ignavibacteria bacterium]|jgi:GxxExxY protein|nr:GxxExxY protein [Ignavibacteria bacterium]
MAVKNDLLTEKIIGCAIEVHKNLGPGLLESVYEECLFSELLSNGLKADRQKVVPIVYKGNKLQSELRLDMLVENSVVLELKSVEKLLPIHEAQLITYLKLSRIHRGLLINFNVKYLDEGIKRRVV